MAKHLVKCLYCNETFDASTEPYVMPNSRRYAHVACAEKHENEKTQEQKDKEELEAYIKKLFNIDKLNGKINKQITTFINENEYSYSGILKCLIYFYEIKGNSIEKANNGIGIVPFIWDETFNYYHQLWIDQQVNSDKKIEEYKPHNIVVKIQSPQRKPRKRKLFSFLDILGD